MVQYPPPHHPIFNNWYVQGGVRQNGPILLMHRGWCFCFCQR
jgi:hypothetical protein